MLNLVALLVTLTALFSYINHRFIKLPTTIGVMVLAMVLSLILMSLGELGYAPVEQRAAAIIGGIDFNQVLMQGMLSLLLFAGALHVNLEELAQNKCGNYARRRPINAFAKPEGVSGYSEVSRTR